MTVTRGRPERGVIGKVLGERGVRLQKDSVSKEGRSVLDTTEEKWTMILEF